MDRSCDRPHRGRVSLFYIKMTPDVTEGLILRVIEYREHDRIVSLYTRDFGKLSALARHATKSRKRFGTQLNTFQLVKVELRQRPNRSLAFLERVRPLTSLEGIYGDWRRIAMACAIVDLLSVMTREGHVSPELYEAAAEALQRINRAQDGPTVLASFQYQLLRLSGFKPALDHCAACDRVWTAQEEAYWVQGAGGLHCRDCLPHGHRFEVVPAEPLQSLVRTVREPEKLQPNEGRRSAILLNQFVCYQLGHPVRSWQFMEQMGLL